MKISTKELIYLEDSSKLCQSIIESCNHAARESQDTQMKSFYQSIAQGHQQLVDQAANLIKQSNLQ